MRRWQTITALLPFIFFALDYGNHQSWEEAFVGAAANGRTNSVRSYLEEGVGVDARGGRGMTALDWAAYGGHSDTVQLLLAHGADPQRAMNSAVTMEHPDIVVMLADAGAHFSGPQGVSALCSAAARGDSATVSALLRYGMDFNAHELEGEDGNESYMTPILYAARSGSWETFHILAARGANLRATSGNDKTALIYAASSSGPSSARICRYLIQHGVNINAADNQGETALKVAQSRQGEGAREVRAVLMQNGAKINADIDTDDARRISIREFHEDMGDVMRNWRRRSPQRGAFLRDSAHSSEGMGRGASGRH